MDYTNVNPVDEVDNEDEENINRLFDGNQGKPTVSKHGDSVPEGMAAMGSTGEPIALQDAAAVEKEKQASAPVSNDREYEKKYGSTLSHTRKQILNWTQQVVTENIEVSQVSDAELCAMIAKAREKKKQASVEAEHPGLDDLELQTPEQELQELRF